MAAETLSLKRTKVPGKLYLQSDKGNLQTPEGKSLSYQMVTRRSE